MLGDHAGMDTGSRERLEACLGQARELGFFGPGPVGVHIDHALGYAEVLAPLAAAVASVGRGIAIADLGSGGGAPGLVLALAIESSELTLIDGKASRCAWLREACEMLEITDRARVLEGEAQNLAHKPGLRASFDAVVARGFAPAATTAEVAAGYLKVGGRLVVSDPPDGAARWDRLSDVGLGFGPAESYQSRGFAFMASTLSDAPGERVPRQGASIRKRPLF